MTKAWIKSRWCGNNYTSGIDVSMFRALIQLTIMEFLAYPKPSETLILHKVNHSITTVARKRLVILPKVQVAGYT